MSTSIRIRSNMKITIEGNISCGKSTILTLLQQNTRLPIFLEQVQSWTMIAPFYKDNSRWGFTFNIEVLYSMFKWKENSFFSIYERSPLSCRKVFTQLQYDNGSMTYDELQLFDKLYNNFGWSQDAIIYINTPPNVCLERMRSRDRSCEKQVELDYLVKVHDAHTRMIQFAQNYLPCLKVFVVDGNQSKEKVYADVENIVMNIQATIAFLN